MYGTNCITIHVDAISPDGAVFVAYETPDSTQIHSVECDDDGTSIFVYENIVEFIEGTAWHFWILEGVRNKTLLDQIETIEQLNQTEKIINKLTNQQNG